MRDELTINVPKSINFSGIEEIYKELPRGSAVKLRLPNTLSHSGGFGLEGFVLQLFFTLMRNSSELTAHTYAISNDNKFDYEELCNHLLGLCFLRLSDKVITADKKETPLSVALDPAVLIFKNIRAEHFKEAFKGRYVAFPVIKSPPVSGGRSREFDMPFYNANDLVGAEKFLKITKDAIESIFPSVSARGLLESKKISNISEIIRELFSNTHRHARADVDGNLYEKNVRAITFRFDSLTKKRMQELSRSGGVNMSLFVADWQPENDKLFNALEITVVDSGPGYARRWSGLDIDDLDYEAESEAVMNCFKKHKSSALGASSGSGLNNVLKDLRSLRGWMRLRTGSLLVEKSFYMNEGEPSIVKKDIRKMDVFIEGVVFNFVIPVNSLIGA